MDFTFGIITDGANDDTIIKIIDSIISNNIPKYEIIIVGNSKILPSDKIRIINFDETIVDKWITKKKNIIVSEAKYENIVLLHDYIIFDNDWYHGFLMYGNNFDVCVNKILNYDNTRFRDYVLARGLLEHEYIFASNCLLPYDFVNNEKTNKYLYISGSYYVIKKYIAQKYPLNENLCWGQGEDYELALRFHKDNIIIKFNKYSTVRFLKQKYQADFFNRVLPLDIANSLNDNKIITNIDQINNYINNFINLNKK
jgi:hypothetical protein